jgi:hypothetical protein
MLQLLVTANAVPSLLILFTQMMEIICSSKTSVVSRATGRHSPEDGILHSRHCENFRANIVFTCLHTTLKHDFCGGELKYV